MEGDMEGRRWIAVLAAAGASLALALAVPKTPSRADEAPLQVSLSVDADGASLRIVQGRFVLAFET
jgi:anti-sigma-K factor RskA